MFNSIKKVVSIVWWKKSCSYILSCLFGSTLPPHVLIIERTAAFALRFDLAPPSSPCSGDYLTHPRVMFSTELIGVLQLGAVFETPDSSRVIRHPTIFPTKKSSVSPFSKNQNWKKQVFSKSIALSQVLRSFRSAQSDLQWRPVTETLERRSRTAKCCRCDWTDISFAGYLFWWCKWS